jgi:hypothetical protein
VTRVASWSYVWFRSGCGIVRVSWSVSGSRKKKENKGGNGFLHVVFGSVDAVVGHEVVFHFFFVLFQLVLLVVDFVVEFVDLVEEFDFFRVSVFVEYD